MADLLSFVFMLGVTSVIARIAIRRFGANETSWLWAGFFAHVASAVAQVLITRYYYGGGDMFTYYRTGAALRDLVLADPWTWALPVLSVGLGGAPTLPIHVIGIGSSTGAMSGISAWALLVGAGSMYGVCLLFATFAFVGQIALYRALRELFPVEFRKRMIVVVFLIPSVVFWSSAILKEPIALAALGWCVLGIWRFLFTGHRGRGAVYLALGVGVSAVIKPYVLLPLAGATGVWLYWSRRSSGWSSQALVRNAVYLGIAIGGAAFGIQYLGEVFPEYSITNLTEKAAYLQSLYYRIDGGSTYQIGEATADAQATNAPLALATVLLRPFIFEAHNIVSLFNAVEMTVIIALIIRVLWRNGVRSTAKRILSSPVLMFFVTFVLLLGVGVGLGAPNLGSLSRYRILLMPFYVATIVCFLPVRQRAPAPARRPLRPLTTR